MSQLWEADMQREEQTSQLQAEWADSPRWKGIKRDYTAADVVKLRGLGTGRTHACQTRRRKIVASCQSGKAVVRVRCIDR